MSDDCGPSLLCDTDIAYLDCAISCAVQGVIGATTNPVQYYKFRPDLTQVDRAFGDAVPVFDAAIELAAEIKTEFSEQDLTAYGARSTGRKDNTARQPDAVLYIPTKELDAKGVTLDTEHRDEFVVRFNGKDRRCNVIGSHYPESLGIAAIVEVYLCEVD